MPRVWDTLEGVHPAVLQDETLLATRSSSHQSTGAEPYRTPSTPPNASRSIIRNWPLEL